MKDCEKARAFRHAQRLNAKKAKKAKLNHHPTAKGNHAANTGKKRRWNPTASNDGHQMSIIGGRGGRKWITIIEFCAPRKCKLTVATVVTTATSRSGQGTPTFWKFQLSEAVNIAVYGLKKSTSTHLVHLMTMKKNRLWCNSRSLFGHKRHNWWAVAWLCDGLNFIKNTLRLVYWQSGLK